MNKIPVFFMPEMVADSKGFSPSPGKPGLVVEAWAARGFPIEVRSFQPCTADDLALAHDRRFVDAVLAGEMKNGFGTKDAAVARSLPYTTGSMLAALTEALCNGVGAVSPTSGFHHAGYDFTGGFCTFNGLMVAALSFPELSVGILDFDYHYGNGTQAIINRLGHWAKHYSQGLHHDKDPDKWLRGLPALIKYHFSGCDVVLYQAGQDPHIDDPLGGWLTTSELAERDAIVFSTLRALRIPVVWNLAGGYQGDFNKVINGHVNTMVAFSNVFFKR